MTLLLVAGLGVVLALHLDHFYQWDNDEGIYALTGRAVLQGFEPYSEVWMDQPPGAAYGLALAFRLLGETVPVGRGVALVAALLGVLGVAAIARRLAGDLAGWAAALLIVLSPHFWWLSRSINPHLPSLAFGVLGLAVVWRYRDTGRRWLLPLAGLLLGVALWIKLSPAYLAAPMAVLVLQRARLEAGPGWRRSLVRVAVAGLYLALPVLLVCGAWFLVAPPAEVWHGVFGVYARARDVYPDRTLEYLDWLVRENLFGENLGLLALGMLATLWLARPPGSGAAGGPGTAWRRSDALALGLWFALSCLAVVFQRPLFAKHHWSILLWPMAVGAGIGTAVVLRLAGSALRARSVPAGARGWLALGGLAGALSLFAAWNNAPAMIEDLNPKPFYAAQEGIAWIHANTGPDDAVISDNGLVVFRSGRSTPPSLVNFASKRIRTLNLHADDLIAATRDSRAAAVLLWNDQITDFPEYMDWLAQHYVMVQDMGDDRFIWQRRDLARAATP